MQTGLLKSRMKVIIYAGLGPVTTGWQFILIKKEFVNVP